MRVQNRTIRKVLHKCRVFRDYLAYNLINIFFGVKKNRYFFSSFLGKSYSDNPRAISEMLHKIEPNSEIVWQFQNVAMKRNIVPDYVKCVNVGSLEALFYQCTATVWVDNYCKSVETKKRKDQIYIQTWHGDRPFKKVLMDAFPGTKLFESANCDFAIAGSDFGERVYKSSFGYNGKILKYGCPRNDKLINGDDEICFKIKEIYHIPDNHKILLYAPTFRDTNKDNNQTVEDLNFDKVLAALENVTGNRWCLLVRGHTGRNVETELLIKHQKIDVTDYEDANDILLVSDALISDYSSIATDFALTGKPVFLYINDLEKYETQDRSLWFNFSDTPFWYARNSDELLELISKCNDNGAQINCNKILDFYKTVETGKSTEYICRLILEINNK